MRQETNQRFEAVDRRFEALQKEIRDGFTLQREAIQDLKIMVDTVGARWGEETEEVLRQTLKKFLLEKMEVKEIKEWRGKDKEGFVFESPSEIQIDLLLKNKKHYLVELKSSAGSGDVFLLLRKAKFYEKQTGIKPEMIFVAVRMREEGKRLCKRLKVRLISYGERKVKSSYLKRK
jgi:hypothetical protein